MATGQASTLALYNWHLSEQREREREGEVGREGGRKKREERDKDIGERREKVPSAKLPV